MMQKSSIFPAARRSGCSGTVTCLEEVKRPIHANMERLVRPSRWIQPYSDPVLTSVVGPLSIIGKIACRTNGGVHPNITFLLLRLCGELAHNTEHSHRKNHYQSLVAKTMDRYFLNFDFHK